MNCICCSCAVYTSAQSKTLLQTDKVKSLNLDNCRKSWHQQNINQGRFSFPKFVSVNALQNKNTVHWNTVLKVVYHCWVVERQFYQTSVYGCPAMPALFWRDYVEVFLAAWRFLSAESCWSHMLFVHICVQVGMIFSNGFGFSHFCTYLVLLVVFEENWFMNKRRQWQ